MQDEIIKSISEGHDTLALMPTGGGKSITFQVPAMATEGICIVVTPLIALMLDQVENLKKKNIKALVIYSGMSQMEIDIAFDNALYGDYKFLYCSPERLGTDIFKGRVQKMKVNLIAIDEAHCISQWGYDFRPSYMRIAELRDLLPGVPVLALTATATLNVIDDIQNRLHFKTKNVLRKSFERKNIVYLVRETDDKLNYLLKIINSIPGSGIVYARNRQKTKEIATHLIKNGIKADFYNAGLTSEARTFKQNNWKTGKIQVIVATNAFGMGIDKADVRFVIHTDVPDSLEAYYQEAGRGGRDEKKAYAVLLFNNSDKLSADKRVDSNFPDIKLVKNIYNALGNYLQIPYGGGKFISFDFNMLDFAITYKQNLQVVHSSLKLLEQEGYIEISDELNNPAKITFLVSRDDLYKFQVVNQAYDAFIKLLLRSYEGLFSKYVPIDVLVLSKRANTSVENINKYLSKLSSSKIIHYIPRQKNPVVVYTEERLDDKNLHIGYENYTTRKERYVNKLNAIMHYATSVNKCRSELILQYFGEENTQRCGQCDVCVRRNEIDISKYEFDLMVNELKKELQNEPIELENIAAKLEIRFGKEKTIKAIRFLLDNGKIEQNQQLKLFWKH